MDSNGKELHGPEWGGPEPTTERTCLICGCTDSKACEGGCNWIEGLACREDICSKCITDRVPDFIEVLILFVEKPDDEEVQAIRNGKADVSISDLVASARKIAEALRQ